MNKENIMNDDELLNVSGGIFKEHTDLVYKNSKGIKAAKTVFDKQTQVSNNNLVYVEENGSKLDGKLLSGGSLGSGTPC